MRGMARVFTSMLVAALPAATMAQGQVPVVTHAVVVDVPTKVLCGDCSIHLTRVVRLGTGSGAGEFYNRPLAVSRLPGVGFAVTESEGGRLLVYGEAGDFRKVVGRPGEGPSELSAPGPMVVIGGDSVAVVDFGNGRMAILDPVSLTISRTVRFDVSLAMGMGEFKGHQILLTGASSQPSRIGLPIHSIDLSKDPIQVHSFGSVDGLAIDLYQQERVVASLGDDVWSLRRSEYLLEKWDWVTGARLQALRIRPSWFEDSSRGWMGLPNAPPEPRMYAVRVGDDQRVWVYGLLPAKTWQDAWAHVGPLDGRRELTGADRPHYEKMFATQIEVIDPRRAARITVLTWDRMIGGVLDDGRVWTFARDELDRFFIDVWDVFLSTNGG